MAGVDRSGRGFNPRPALTGIENIGWKSGRGNQLKGLIVGGVLSGLELRESIWRGWIVPVGGSTPDRH